MSSIQEKLEEMYPLKPGTEYDGYFSCIQAALTAYRSYMEKEENPPLSKGSLQNCVDRIAMTLHLVKLKYLFDADVTVDIDAHYSGFPGSYYLAILEHDLKNGQNDGALSQRELRKVFLDSLFKQGEVSNDLLHDLATRQYLDELQGPTPPLLPFQIVEMKIPNDARNKKEYAVSWISFDGLKNLPCIYTMFFEYSGTEEFTPESAYMRKFLTVLRDESNDMPLIGDLAHNIDSGLADVHPKYLNRTIIGPVFIPGLTFENDGVLELLASQPEGEKSIFSYAMQITYEDIQSSGQSETGVVAKELGIDRRFENFQINDLDERCSERKATRVRQVLFVPHSIAQSISSEDAQRLNHEIVTFDKNGGLL